jgi:hypothetical protein
MASHRVSPAWDFLHHASLPSLESFELSRLNHTANLRKEVAALLEQWIEELAEAMVARWIREDRKLFPQRRQGVGMLSDAELPLPAQSIALQPRQAERRLRPRRAPPAV